MQLLKRKPDVALHIITMNRANKLERVLSNCYGHFDVIRVCDGGSIDNTINVCHKYKCQVIHNKWQDNMSIQHNKLLRQAEPGDKIFILDDDEYPSSQLLERLPYLLTEEASTFLNIPFGLVFIDGNHGYDDCLFDITTWGNKLVSGGIILVHDYHPEIDSDPVTKVVHEALRDNNSWEHLETIGSMTVWQKG